MINFTTRMDISNKAHHLVDNLMAETDHLKEANNESIKNIAHHRSQSKH